MLADGIGGARGGRIAAETAVRGFLDGFCDLPETIPVHQAAANVAATLNRWIHAQAQRDTLLAGMGCTFTALILRGHTAHVLHAGDSRLYRLRGGSLACLTSDHLRHTNDAATLTRALGVEADLRLDYLSQPAALHDRYLLTSDGLHGALAPETMTAILRERPAPRTPPALWSPRRWNAEQATTAPPWCWMSCICLPRHMPTSPAPSRACL